MKYDKKFSLNILIIMLAFSAGLIIFACAFAPKLPNGVIINGTEVGGKTYVQAAEIIRGDIINNLKTKCLTVHGNNGDYVFRYPEISFKDDLQKILKSAKKGGEYTTEVRYYLNGLTEIASSICSDESAPTVEPYAIFNAEGEPFTYFEGQDGLKADRLKLINDIRASLAGNFEEVRLNVTTVPKSTSIQTVKYNTRLLSTFTTYYVRDNTDRVHNVHLAAQLINGTVLENGDCFSFNGVVGQRTAERGFRPAKIIEHGEFVEGIGGGVCQVSTTLYNAALLAGCDVTEFHPHSLAVSYVPPSFDAMVSGNYYDLKFENLTGYTLYIRADFGDSFVTFNIYGRGDGAQYGYQSVVTGNIPAPEETTSDGALVKEGRDGIISEGYLVVTRNGVSKSTLFRRDKYAPIKRVTLETSSEQEDEDGQPADTQ